MVESVLLFLLSLTPSLLAFQQRHPKAIGITLINILLGLHITGLNPGAVAFMFTLVFTTIDPEDWDEGIRSWNKLKTGIMTPISDARTTAENPENETKAKLEQLLENISCKEPHRLAIQALDQLELLDNHRKDFQDMLNRKLNKGELTYCRYHAALENLNTMIVSNLTMVASILGNLEDIDLSYISHYLSVFRQSSSQSSADLQCYQSLLERADILILQTSQVSEVLAANEIALTQLEKLLASISTLNLVSGRNPPSFDQTMEELADLTNQVDKYQMHPVFTAR